MPPCQLILLRQLQSFVRLAQPNHQRLNTPPGIRQYRAGSQLVELLLRRGQLDDLSGVLTVDTQRVYACGMSNGGMMCYRLASELSDRIAAIAPVAGTVAIEESHPTRPVSVIHLHGLNDTIVPYEQKGKAPPFMKILGVEDSIRTWVKLNGCHEFPNTETISADGDEMTVTRKTYPAGNEGSEVVLIAIDKGGHTWPGQKPPVGFISRSAMNISANDLIWDFFQKHPMK